VGNGLQAETIGKPERKFFEVCLRDLGVNLEGDKGRASLKIEDVAVVGDDIEADLSGGAIELGLQRILGNNSLVDV
jgi:ribonucleotide monophosphatase NagD (HAD superfamily)